MNKDFVPYEPSLALKELGFDEPCFAWYDGRYPSSINQDYCKNPEEWLNVIHCATPTFSQAFRFFREKYNLQVYIDFYHKDSYFYKIKSQVGKRISNTTEDVILQGIPVFPRTYEEAELACLIKLIEIVKNK